MQHFKLFQLKIFHRGRRLGPRCMESFYRLTNVGSGSEAESTKVLRRTMAKRLAAKPAATAPPSSSASATRDALDRSFAPKNHQFKAPEGVISIPLFDHAAPKNAKSEDYNLMGTITLRLSPGQIEKLVSSLKKKTPPKLDQESIPEQNFPLPSSPIIGTSRGKTGARKDRQLRLGIGRSPSNEIPTKDTVMQNLNISVEDEEKTAQYFKYKLEREIDRLQELCEKWVKIKSDPDLSEDIQSLINQAVEQTNLLIDKKFDRFGKLVLDCETGKGQMLVTSKYLQGFWDMLYSEVEDCDAQFRKLEELMTLAARKKKNMEEENQVGFVFVVTSPRKSVPEECKIPTPRSTEESASCLLRKPMKSPLAIVTVDQFCKTPEVEVDDTITYVNSNRKPGRSILKRVEESSITTPNSTRAQQQLKVHFNDYVTRTEVPVDEEVQDERDLAAKSARIDNYDTEKYCEDRIEVRAEKQLSFSDDSFVEIEEELQHNIARLSDGFELDNTFGQRMEDEATPEDIDRSTPDIVEMTPLSSSRHVRISKRRKNRENEPVEDSSKKVKDKDSSQDVEPGRKPLLEIVLVEPNGRRKSNVAIQADETEQRSDKVTKRRTSTRESDKCTELRRSPRLAESLSLEPVQPRRRSPRLAESLSLEPVQPRRRSPRLINK